MAKGKRRAFGQVLLLPSGRYRARYRLPNGRFVNGPTTFRTKGEAEAWLASQRAKMDRGEQLDVAGGRKTLESYARAWLASRITPSGQPLRPRTVDLYRGLLEHHILSTLGGLPLNRLDPPTIRRWYLELLEAESPSIAPKAYRLLRTILSTAVDDRLIGSNPCRIVGAGVEQHAERPTATVAEVDKLADAVGPRFRTLVLLATYSGLRLGELLGLRRGDIDVHRRLVAVRRQRQVLADGTEIEGPPKTAAGVRMVTVPQFIAVELARHLLEYAQPGDDGYVFTGYRGGPLSRHWWWTHYRATADELGMAHLRFHDLRHTGNTLAAQAGANQADLMARMGHASPDAARRYLHATSDRDREIADALDRLARVTSVSQRNQTGP